MSRTGELRELLICAWCLDKHFPPPEDFAADMLPCETRGCQCWCQV